MLNCFSYGDMLSFHMAICWVYVKFIFIRMAICWAYVKLIFIRMATCWVYVKLRQKHVESLCSVKTYNLHFRNKGLRTCLLHTPREHLHLLTFNLIFNLELLIFHLKTKTSLNLSWNLKIIEFPFHPRMEELSQIVEYVCHNYGISVFTGKW